MAYIEILNLRTLLAFLPDVVVMVIVPLLIGITVTVVGGLILYHRFGIGKREDAKEKQFFLKFAEETITFEEKLRSQKFDVIKINAHDHTLGIRAEYSWIKKNYPGSKIGDQYLVEHEFKAKGKNKRVVNFDMIDVTLADGREKYIYFEIDSFFAKGKPTSFEEGYDEEKLREIYS